MQLQSGQNAMLNGLFNGSGNGETIGADRAQAECDWPSGLSEDYLRTVIRDEFQKHRENRHRNGASDPSAERRRLERIRYRRAQTTIVNRILLGVLIVFVMVQAFDMVVWLKSL